VYDRRSPGLSEKSLPTDRYRCILVTDVLRTSTTWQFPASTNAKQVAQSWLAIAHERFSSPSNRTIAMTHVKQQIHRIWPWKLERLFSGSQSIRRTCPELAKAQKMYATSLAEIAWIGIHLWSGGSHASKTRHRNTDCYPNLPTPLPEISPSLREWADGSVCREGRV